MASVTITKHTMKSMCSGQMGHIYRLHKNYSNKDISMEQSNRNIIIGGSAEESRRRLRERVAEVDAVLPPKRVRKDRVTAIEFCIPAPREDMTEEQQVEFLKKAYLGISRKFGNENIICGVIHLDEIHEYKDVDGIHKSRAHLHIVGVPYVPGKGINGKEFLKRETYKEVNKSMDNICEVMFSHKYQDGSKQKSRGTVEQLKQGEKNAIEYETQLKGEIKAKMDEYEEKHIKPLKSQIKALQDEKTSLEQEKKLLNCDIVNCKARIKDLEEKMDKIWDILDRAEQGFGVEFVNEKEVLQYVKEIIENEAEYEYDYE